MKLSVLNKNINVNRKSKTVSIAIEFDTNLKWFEQQFIGFDVKTIKNIISRHLGVSKSISEVRDGYSIIVNNPTIHPQIAEYDYEPKFYVTATAKCSGNDEFDENKGSILAESRAKTEAYFIMKQICDDLKAVMKRSFDELDSCSKHMKSMLNYEKQHRVQILDESVTE